MRSWKKKKSGLKTRVPFPEFPNKAKNRRTDLNAHDYVSCGPVHVSGRDVLEGKKRPGNPGKPRSIKDRDMGDLGGEPSPQQNTLMGKKKKVFTRFRQSSPVVKKHEEEGLGVDLVGAILERKTHLWNLI